MVEITQIHVSILVNHLGEIGIIRTPVALIHLLHSSSDCGSRKNDLSFRSTLLNQLILSTQPIKGFSHSVPRPDHTIDHCSNLVFIPCIKHSVQLINYKMLNIANEQLLMVFVPLQSIKGRDHNVNSAFQDLSLLAILTCPIKSKCLQRNIMGENFGHL